MYEEIKFTINFINRERERERESRLRTWNVRTDRIHNNISKMSPLAKENLSREDILQFRGNHTAFMADAHANHA